MSQYDNETELPETPFDEVTDIVGVEEEVPESSMRRFRLPSWKSLIFIVAVLLSPVFGLVFGMDFALGVLVVAMVFTTWMVWEGAEHAPAGQGPRLRRAAMLNGIVTLAVLTLLLLRQIV